MFPMEPPSQPAAEILHAAVVETSWEWESAFSRLDQLDNLEGGPADPDAHGAVIGNLGGFDVVEDETIPLIAGPHAPADALQHPSYDARHPAGSSKPKRMGDKRKRSEIRQGLAASRKSVNGPARARLYTPKASALRYHSKWRRFDTTVDGASLPHCQAGSWIGKREGRLQNAPWTKETLVNEHGFKLVEYVRGRDVVVADRQGRMIGGVFEGPKSSGWAEAVAEATQCLRAASTVALETGAYGLPPFKDERRGAFVAIPVGTSTGGGQQRPGPLFHHIKARRIIGKSIVRNLAMRRLCGAQSAAFAFLAPKMFNHYTRVIGAMYDNQPELIANFDNSIFTAASFNCGPQTVSLDHFDHNNLSYGPCALTPLGQFDYKQGGHLILFDLKLVIEFPPGTIAIIPSAAVRHGNTPIAPDEDRMSVAQYCAGGIFRWVAYGCKTGTSLDATKAGKARKLQLNGGYDERWSEGLGLYSTADSWANDLKILM